MISGERIGGMDERLLTKGGKQPLEGVLVPLFGDVEDKVEAHLTRHAVLLQIPGDQQTQPLTLVCLETSRHNP